MKTILNQSLRNIINERILVTGASGIIGKQLTKYLLLLGTKEIVCTSRIRRTSSDKRIIWKKVDLTSEDETQEVVKERSVIFHLAGIKHDTVSDSEVSSYGLNELITSNLVKCAAAHKIKKIIFTSSALVYGKPDKLPVQESHKLRPISPYAKSKLSCEQILLEFASQYPLKIVIARCCNIYGGKHEPETVIGRIIESIREENRIQLYHLNTVRDFIHLEDAAEGLIRLGASDDSKSSEITSNLTTSQGTSIKELTELAQSYWEEQGKGQLEVIEESPDTDIQIPELFLDNSFLKKTTDWSPAVKIEEGLQRLLDRELKNSLNL